MTLALFSKLVIFSIDPSSVGKVGNTQSPNAAMSNSLPLDFVGTIANNTVITLAVMFDHWPSLVVGFRWKYSQQYCNYYSSDICLLAIVGRWISLEVQPTMAGLRFVVITLGRLSDSGYYTMVDYRI